MSGSLKKSIIRGTVVTVLGNAANALLRLVSNVLLTRLLFPEHFGTMALVFVVLTGLQMLSDVGVGPSIIQNRRGEEPTFLNTAWTIQVIRGGLLWVFACAIAWPMAHFYDRPQLSWLIPVTGLSALIGGFESTRLFTANRNLALVRVVGLELVAQLASLGTMVAIAARWHSIWALTVGATVAALVKTILRHTVLPGNRDRFARNTEARDELVSFGRWIFLSTAVTYFSGQSDKLILGKLVDSAALGVYGLATTLSSLPGTIVHQASHRVFFPAVSNMMRRPDHDPSEVRVGRTRLLMLLAPFFGVGTALVVPAVQLVYDKRYQEMGPLTMGLLLGVWLNTLTVSYGAVLLAAGRPKFIAVGTAIKTVVFVALLWVAMRHLGLLGAAVAISVAELGVLGASIVGCRSLGVVTLAADFKATAVVALFTAVTMLIYRGLLGATGLLPLAFGVALFVGLAGAALTARAANRALQLRPA
jgi:O-antigen/teichoic acid export membrane protein